MGLNIVIRIMGTTAYGDAPYYIARYQMIVFSVWHSAVQYSEVWLSAVQYSDVWHSVVQYSTVQ